jgi:hypothetical protein
MIQKNISNVYTVFTCLLPDEILWELAQIRAGENKKCI